MQITGIICEYNPLHTGHKKQLDYVRSVYGPDSGIVCLMSGNFVQRGAPAIIDKSCRAQAALSCGADLVLELPIPAALSSAEGFAAAGVSILAPFCDALCFGAETADKALLLRTAEALLSPEFSQALRAQLESGKSFPAARQCALDAMGVPSELLSQPNNILAVEYCKAILHQHAAMEPLPISRGGSYHAVEADRDNPSATSLRSLMVQSGLWLDYVPKAARSLFENASLHTLSAGERAILYRLRTMTDQEFSQLPYGSEGLWRKLMHASRREATLEAILTATKSKRYTRSRLDRMVMCALLGLTAEDMSTPAPYARVLALNETGREILKLARKAGDFPNTGEKIPGTYQDLEDRTDALYGLFSVSAPDAAPRRRIYYSPKIGNID